MAWQGMAREILIMNNEDDFFGSGQGRDADDVPIIAGIVWMCFISCVLIVAFCALFKIGG